MYDLTAQKWVDLQSRQSRAVSRSWDGVLQGELVASVPPNTNVRLELRSKVSSTIRIAEARIWAPICVRDQATGNVNDGRQHLCARSCGLAQRAIVGESKEAPN
jgi:hypothetical protein